MSDPNSDSHPAAAFVHAFHADLSHWFAGTDDRETVLARLRDGTPDSMVLVYPSGERMNGADFLQSIAGLYGRSPNFVASISDLELVRGDAEHAVVSYVETQIGARQSASSNRRSALAVILCDGDRCRWRFIQETAIAD